MPGPTPSTMMIQTQQASDLHDRGLLSDNDFALILGRVRADPCRNHVPTPVVVDDLIDMLKEFA